MSFVQKFMDKTYVEAMKFILGDGAGEVKQAEPKQAKAKEFKHMTFYEAAKLAKDAEAAEMWLTHFSPSLVGPQRYMDEVQKIFPAAELGKDGRSVELLFEEETKNE